MLPVQLAMPLALMVGAAIAATTTPEVAFHDQTLRTPSHLLDDGHGDMRMLRISVQPGASLPLHRDAVPNAGYLVEGELVVSTPEGSHKVMKPGDCLTETLDAIHRGTAGPRGATVVVFYANEMPASS
ncbi:cupin domain-containing protein [Luteibacter yeojuensis]|uniref:Cupin type-2 domain-containing protein n=1 Tax=Luteibacter yeojuensis TaxID=345309 RepID=A0A7X5TRA3_9GAMM|nr:cupin domain-containing protein [Luteibacter yeojuensis]NID16955.1 hypothetical protein [Luteibacter yeojuensis]